MGQSFFRDLLYDQNYWNYTKINAWQAHEAWTLAGKATKLMNYMAALLIGDGYFHIGKVIMITVFPSQFLVIIQSCCYNTEY